MAFRLRVILTVLLFASLLPLPSLAQPIAPPSAAQESSRLKQEGDDAMTRLHFADALRAYDEAYALEPSPALLYNRGRALQLLDRLPEALDAFEAFQREADDELKGRVPKLDALVEEIRGKVAALELAIRPDGVAVLYGGRELGVTPFAAPVRVNAGEGVVLELRKEGYHTVERRLDLRGGATEKVDLTLERRDTTALVIVRSPIAGASVSIDGTAIGVVPAERYLPPGEHRVEVLREGYEDAERNVVLAAGERKTIDVPLEETPALYERWWFWTAIGATVAGGVALTVALTTTTERSADEGTIPPGQVSIPIVSF